MSSHTIFTELKKILADLYVDPADAKRIAAEAGLDLAQIPFDAKAINNWHNILVVAIRQRRLDGLLDVVLMEYPAQRALKDAQAAHLRLLAEGG